MQSEVTALELKYLVKELQVLVGSRVDTIYQPDELYVQVHKSGAGKMLLRIEKNALWLTKKKPEMPPLHKNFCQLLRKILEGKKITKVEQLDGERIIRTVFETQSEKKQLFIELFGKGNVILADEEGIVHAAIEERAWKDRTTKRGLPYKLPPHKGNVLDLKEEDFAIEDDSVSKSLARKGLGKFYANEVCARSKVDPQAAKITYTDKKALFKAYKSILSDGSGAHVYGNEVAPFRLSQEGGKKYESFCAAIDDNFTKQNQKSQAKQQAFDDKKKRIENLIALQEKGKNEAEKQADELQKCGEFIYEHCQEFKDILDELNKAKEKYSLQEIKAKLKGHKSIKDVNPKTGDVVVEL
ncbi:MAG TPA: NFACT family protein [Candidatus Nanoarchaeia archaeon]|nr:NFACT family protein [Candidatus Nanoarchaeia archaeon]